MSKEPTLLISSDGVPFDVQYHGGNHVVVTGKVANGKTFCMNHLAEAMKSQFIDPAGTMKKTIIPFKDNIPLILGETRSGKTSLQVLRIDNAIQKNIKTEFRINLCVKIPPPLIQF